MSIRVLGIIGSGQLGSLLCQAAKKLNIKTIVISDDENGPAQNYYAGTVQCGVFTPRNKGSVDSVAIAESVIDGLTSVNEPGHASLFFRRFNTQEGKELLTQAGDNLGGMTGVIPRVGQINGPTAVTEENNSHFVSVVSCRFTAV